MVTDRPPSRRLPLLGLLALGACLASAPTPATAEAITPSSGVHWHASLQEARQAARVSQYPVLVVVTSASSDAGAAGTQEVFSAPETIALLTACFESVRIDIDSDPSVTQMFGVTTTPAVCILDDQDRPVSTFACPPTPAAFLAAVSRAAQDSSAPQSAASPVQVAAASLPRRPATGMPSAHGDEPALPPTPPSWPAEATAQPMRFAPDATITARVRPSLEPTPAQPTPVAPAPDAAAPWLADRAVTPATASAGEPRPAADTADVASAPTTTGTSAPEAPPAKQSFSESFLAALRKPFTIFAARPEAAAATPSAAETAAASTAAVPEQTDGLGPMPLGLEGYCPVTLVDKGAWVEGRAQWGARHRGRTYLFAGSDQQRAFLADPDRYAPALSGDDPVVACDSGRQVAGQRRYGVTYQARTYLFSTPETRAAFAANPQRYTTRVMLAERPAASDTLVR